MNELCKNSSSTSMKAQILLFNIILQELRFSEQSRSRRARKDKLMLVVYSPIVTG